MKLPCKVHEAANIFPMMSAEEFAGLVEDMKENGCSDPVVFYDDKLIDGRNRMAAMLELEIDWKKHRTFLPKDSDPIAYVISHNLHRRHLNATQRGMAAAKALPLYEAQAKERQRARKGEQPGATKENVPYLESEQARDAAGKAFGVSGKTVDAAKVVAESGNTELIELAQQGKVSVNSVAKELREDKDAAAELVQRIKAKEAGEKLPKKRMTKREKAKLWSDLSSKLSSFSKLFEKHAQECDEAEEVCEALDALTDKYNYYVRNVESE